MSNLRLMIHLRAAISGIAMGLAIGITFSAFNPQHHQEATTAVVMK